VIAHVPVDLIPCGVRKEFLVNQESGHGELVPGKIFALSSYKGHALTFQVLLASGALFSYLPIHALVVGERSGVELSLDELLYHDCRDSLIAVHRFPALAGVVQVHFKKRDLWLSGSYHLSVDWYRGNDLLHLVQLENGQLCALPSHKILFGTGPEGRGFPGYKKMRQTWTVGR
jgi:hypothetical protein